MSRSNSRPQTGVTAYEVSTAQAPATPSPLSPSHAPIMTRRAALKAMLGVSVAAAGMLANPLQVFSAEATQETLDALSAAETAYNEAQEKLSSISDEFVTLNQQLNETATQIEQVQSQIDAKQTEIDAKQKEIDAKQADIEDKQDQLSARISSNYKTGSSNLLSVLLNSESFEQLANSLTYMGKVNKSDESLINEVKQAKAELEDAKATLEEAKASLETQKGNLEVLKAEQTEQLEAVQAKQEEASSLVASLSDDVRELVEKRDAEILAAAEEEKRQKEAEEAARKAAAAAASSSSSGGAQSGVTGTISNISASEKGAKIVAACSQVGSPGSGLCAMWVSQVYNAAGLGYPGGNANNMYWNYCTSSDKSAIEPGMIVAVSTHPHSSAGRIYGHVGIYIGNGKMMDNIGYIRTISLDSWISYYGDLVTPRWGWAA